MEINKNTCPLPLRHEMTGEGNNGFLRGCVVRRHTQNPAHKIPWMWKRPSLTGQKCCSFEGANSNPNHTFFFPPLLGGGSLPLFHNPGDHFLEKPISHYPWGGGRLPRIQWRRVAVVVFVDPPPGEAGLRWVGACRPLERARTTFEEALECRLR